MPTDPVKTEVEAVKTEPKADAKAAAHGPWKITQAPRYSPPYLNPNDGGFWLTEYSDGEKVMYARGDSSERSRANAQTAVNRRNKE